MQKKKKKKIKFWNFWEHPLYEKLGICLKCWEPPYYCCCSIIAGYLMWQESGFLPYIFVLFLRGLLEGKGGCCTPDFLKNCVKTPGLQLQILGTPCLLFFILFALVSFAALQQMIFIWNSISVCLIISGFHFTFHFVSCLNIWCSLMTMLYLMIMWFILACCYNNNIFAYNFVIAKCPLSMSHVQHCCLTPLAIIRVSFWGEGRGRRRREGVCQFLFLLGPQSIKCSSASAGCICSTI